MQCYHIGDPTPDLYVPLAGVSPSGRSGDRFLLHALLNPPRCQVKSFDMSWLKEGGGCDVKYQLCFSFRSSTGGFISISSRGSGWIPMTEWRSLVRPRVLQTFLSSISLMYDRDKRGFDPKTRWARRVKGFFILKYVLKKPPLSSRKCQCSSSRPNTKNQKIFNSPMTKSPQCVFYPNNPEGEPSHVFLKPNITACLKKPLGIVWIEETWLSWRKACDGALPRRLQGCKLAP